MSDKPSFTFKIVETVLEVRITGTWTVQADMAYLSSFGEYMSKMRGNSWAVLIDMRGWVLPESVFLSKFKAKIFLDRRNQKAECWIVDHLQQGELLMPFFKGSNLSPERFLGVKEAETWLGQQGFDYSYIPDA